MNAAFLFNSDAPKYGFSYGDPIRRSVFGLGMVQASNRHMKVSVGDVTIYGRSKSWDQYDKLTEQVYFSGSWSMLLENKLRETFRKATVYSIIFENMPKDLAILIHTALISDDAYLGVMEVDYTYGPHLALMRNSMITLLRIEGAKCRVFYQMGEEDARDEHEITKMSNLGYTDVNWEDRGAHGTIFDDFDTIHHFNRVSSFRKAVAPMMPGGDDEAYELVMVLEDLNPQLFNVMGAAVRAIDQAQTEEDIAQAALSGRRYIESLADALYPASKQKFKSRKVGKAEYKNRIWAFIELNTARDETQLKALGTELDRLIEEFNAGLHGNRTKTRILQALVDLGLLTAGLLALNPSGARKPYFAHQRKMVEFYKEALTDSNSRECK